MKQAVLKGRVKPESHLIHHSTAAQYSYRNESDVTGLKALEQVRNKFSFRESILLQISHAVCSFISFESTGLNTSVAINQNDYAEKGRFLFITHNKLKIKIATFR